MLTSCFFTTKDYWSKDDQCNKNVVIAGFRVAIHGIIHKLIHRTCGNCVTLSLSLPQPERPMPDRCPSLRDAIRQAYQDHTPLCIQGGGSKSWLGRSPEGTPLAVGEHRGVVSYDPTELVITARCGTPLAELEAELAAAGQCLPFEPPRFGATDTLGGVIACGLSGPARPYAGAARDMVLGVGLIDGKGEPLRFGGQVMKNVAGYDLSRLMVGAYGTLGVLLDVALKVLPKPARERTLAFACAQDEAIARMNRWAGQPLPLSAAAWEDGVLRIRLSGTEAGVADAQAKLGGDTTDDAYWTALRDQRAAFFTAPQDTPLWRLSVAPAAPVLALDAATLVDWGGAQRWLRTHAPAETVRSQARAAGGHAQCFRGGDRQGEVVQRPEPGLMQLHIGLKKTFDPRGILNPGRMYADI